MVLVRCLENELEANILDGGIELYPREDNRMIQCSVEYTLFYHISAGIQTAKECMFESQEPIQSNLLHTEKSEKTIGNHLELTCLPSNPSTQWQERCKNCDERNGLQSPSSSNQLAAYMSTTSGFQGQLTVQTKPLKGVRTAHFRGLEVHKSTSTLRHRYA